MRASRTSGTSWTRAEEELAYLLEGYRTLPQFVTDARATGDAIVIYLN